MCATNLLLAQLKGKLFDNKVTYKHHNAGNSMILFEILGAEKLFTKLLGKVNQLY